MTTGLIDSPSQLRRLTDADLATAQALSAEAAWPHRLEDWQFALRVGAGLGAFARSGELIATTLWWPYGANFATLGLVITSPPHQGRGIGRRMMDAAIESIGPRSIMLNATQAGLRLYEATGFARVASVRQHQGVATTLPQDKPEPGAIMRPMIEAGMADYATMLRGAPPPTDDASAIFALVSQALG